MNELRINFRGGFTPSAPPTGNQWLRFPKDPSFLGNYVPQDPSFIGNQLLFSRTPPLFLFDAFLCALCAPLLLLPAARGQDILQSNLWFICNQKKTKLQVNPSFECVSEATLDGAEGVCALAYLLSSVFQLVSQVVHIYKYFILSSSYLR